MKWVNITSKTINKTFPYESLNVKYLLNIGFRLSIKVIFAKKKLIKWKTAYTQNLKQQRETY